MASIARNHLYTVDLDKQLTRQNIGLLLATGDDNGDVFNFDLVNADALGENITVVAYFIRNNSETVPMYGTISGSRASVALPAACYVDSGYFTLAVRLASNGVKTTIAVIDGYLRTTTTDIIIDPGHVVPTFDDLLVKIAEMEAATADAWAAAESAAVAKEMIEAIDSPVAVSFVSGNITNGGTVSSSNTARIRSATPILITAGMRWMVDDRYRASVAIYNDAAFTGANFAGFVGGSTSAMYSGMIAIPSEYIGKYMGIRVEKYGHESENISNEVATIGEYVTLQDMAQVLSVNNFHDLIADDTPHLLPIRGAASFDWEIGKTIYAAGDEDKANNGAITKLLKVKKNTTIINHSRAVDINGDTFDVYVAEYAGYDDPVFIQRTKLLPDEIYKTLPQTDSIKLMAVYPYSEKVSMTGNLLKANFFVAFAGNITPGDGQRPVYVAFGASTTVGAVHHMDNKAVTYTPYAFPDYIGQVMGLETYNLGNGTTGFVARDDGYKPNFMDMIYRNGSILKEASLITLMFGYGNDKTAGLDFGAWDDYFPYDEVGAFFVDGQTEVNENGIARMLENGATLMGCLNWCIKWIGEHYPKATLVCLFGAPSGNADYPVTVVENAADGAGTFKIPSHKISVGREEEEIDMNTAVDTLRKKLNIPIINLFNDGLPFSYYSTKATNDDGTYAVFSTKGTNAAPVWNSHPNETGYLMYARYLAGRVSEYFKH